MITITIHDREITIDVDEDLRIHDLDSDMDQAAAQIAYWGALWAEAEAEQQELDGAYRSWRAQVGRMILEADGKASEWKVKQEIEADEKFLQFKTAEAACVRNVTLLRAIYEASKSKASLLQSKGAMRRAELEATGMHTRYGEDGVIDGGRISPDEARERLRADKEAREAGAPRPTVPTPRTAPPARPAAPRPPAARPAAAPRAR